LFVEYSERAGRPQIVVLHGGFEGESEKIYMLEAMWGPKGAKMVVVKPWVDGTENGGGQGQRWNGDYRSVVSEHIRTADQGYMRIKGPAQKAEWHRSFVGQERTT